MLRGWWRKVPVRLLGESGLRTAPSVCIWGPLVHVDQVRPVGSRNMSFGRRGNLWRVGAGLSFLLVYEMHYPERRLAATTVGVHELVLHVEFAGWGSPKCADKLAPSRTLVGTYWVNWTPTRGKQYWVRCARGPPDTPSVT